ncbi:MAG TPA: oligopeptide ABC transporter ATP-binding protein OppF, partial [Patescibacteria group bacterium]|nr:oligopeptide ABC transporter ATP-binding protein OppF [Patescibacteria group bacterium]
FKARCRYAKDICSQEMPEFREVAPDHFVACHIV